MFFKWYRLYVYNVSNRWLTRYALFQCSLNTSSCVFLKKKKSGSARMKNEGTPSHEQRMALRHKDTFSWVIISLVIRYLTMLMDQEEPNRRHVLILTRKNQHFLYIKALLRSMGSMIFSTTTTEKCVQEKINSDGPPFRAYRIFSFVYVSLLVIWAMMWSYIH